MTTIIATLVESVTHNYDDMDKNTCWGHATSTSIDSPPATLMTRWYYDGFSGDKYCSRILLAFNTTHLPLGAIIDSAHLFVWVQGLGDNYLDVQKSVGCSLPTVPADYDQSKHTGLYAHICRAGMGYLPPNAFTGGYNDMPLDVSALPAIIVVGGYTMIALRCRDDTTNGAMGTTDTWQIQNGVHKPYLVITFHMAGIVSTPIPTDSGHAAGLYASGFDWTTLRSQADADAIGGANLFVVVGTMGSPPYHIGRGVMTFDLTSIPATEIVDGVKLRAYLIMAGYVDPDHDYQCVVGANVSIPIVVGDYNRASFSPTKYAEDPYTALWGFYYDFILNTEGVAKVQAALGADGCGFAMLEGHDFDNVAPTSGWADWARWDNGTGGNPPILVVDHHTGGPPVPWALRGQIAYVTGQQKTGYFAGSQKKH